MSKVDALIEFTTTEDELNAMRQVGTVLDNIDNKARERILDWLMDKYQSLHLRRCEHCQCDCEQCNQCG